MHSLFVSFFFSSFILLLSEWQGSDLTLNERKFIIFPCFVYNFQLFLSELLTDKRKMTQVYVKSQKIILNNYQNTSQDKQKRDETTLTEFHFLWWWKVHACYKLDIVLKKCFIVCKFWTQNLILSVWQDWNITHKIMLHCILTAKPEKRKRHNTLNNNNGKISCSLFTI